MVWLKDNPLKDEEYTFSYIYDYFGKIVTKELVPGGETVKVTEQNKIGKILFNLRLYPQICDGHDERFDWSTDQ